MDKLNFPAVGPEDYRKRLHEEQIPDESFGPDLLHKHRIDTPAGILSQTVELTTTAQQGEQ